MKRRDFLKGITAFPAIAVAGMPEARGEVENRKWSKAFGYKTITKGKYNGDSFYNCKIGGGEFINCRFFDCTLTGGNVVGISND